MKRRVSVVLFASVMLTCLVACGKAKESDVVEQQTSENEIVNVVASENEVTEELSTNEVEASSKIPVITFETETKDFKAEDGTVLLTGYFHYPVIKIEDNEAATTKIAEDIQKEKELYEQAFSDTLEIAKSDYEISKTDSEYVFQAYTLEYRFYVERTDENIISLKEYFYNYTGGAHGNYGYWGLNYSVMTGQKLTMEDVAKDSKNFQESNLTYLLEEAKTPGYTNRLDVGFEGNFESMILQEGKWYFSNSGMHFFANPYELGCYAAGCIEFVIPYEDLSGLNETYSYKGNYQRRISVGEEISKDINNDKKEEKVLYQVISDGETGETQITFTINGKDFSSELVMESPYYDAYYIIDFDENDDYMEIVLLDYGPSDDPMSNFYRYHTDGTLESLGAVSDLFGNGTCYLESNGVLVGNTRLSLLQTWFAPARWVLNKQMKFEKSKEARYIPDNMYQPKNPILQPVFVYEKMDQNSSLVELKAEDGPVSFVATDDEKWVELKTADEKTYYLYMEDFETIASDGKSLLATSVFGDLTIAD